jgi:hypothetical protein
MFISIASIVHSILGYRERMAQLRARERGTIGGGEDRLDRIEHAIDAIASEVERLSEAQQMNTRLLAESTQRASSHRSTESSG